MGRAFDALELGALEVVKKPELRDWADLGRMGTELLRTIKILARVRVITHVSGRREARLAGDLGQTGAFGPLGRPGAAGDSATRTIVAIGSSTGGPSALRTVFAALPAELPAPVLVAQHITDGFVPGLVEWLDAGCRIRIVVAEEGVMPQAGTVYLAPTGANMVLLRDRIAFAQPAAEHLYIPSADALFESVAATHGGTAVAAILTGMGADGARGLKALRDSGALTIAQDEASCTVFGMPKAAIELGGVDRVLPLASIGPAITECFTA